MVTAEEKLEVLLYRVNEAMKELGNHGEKAWATAYHSLSKGMAALGLELCGEDRSSRKPTVKEIEARLYDEQAKRREAGGN